MVSLLLIELGSEGTVIKDGEDLKELYNSGLIWDYIDNEVINQANLPVTVIGFFPEDFGLSALESRLDKFKSDCDFCGSLETHVSVIDSADWENEWRKYYKPILIGEILILPKWLNTDLNATVVKIDPGMAFGTGNHETTSACIELMQTIEIKDKIVFDVGCGSGILGICAAKLGAKRVFMSDIDSVAIDAAKENVKLNEINETVTLSKNSPKDFGTEADVIIANITADILKSYRDEFYEFLKQGGYLILSGIILSRGEEVSDFFKEKFNMVNMLYRGEWCAMIMRKL